MIRPLLPNKSRGVPRVGHRRVLNGISSGLRTGALDGNSFSTTTSAKLKHFGPTPPATTQLPGRRQARLSLDTKTESVGLVETRKFHHEGFDTVDAGQNHLLAPGAVKTGQFRIGTPLDLQPG